MPASGAALDHTHDALDAVTTNGRWAVKCRCGVTSQGLTLDSAARAHRAHAEFHSYSAATART